MFIRSVLVAVFAAILSVSLPVMGAADGTTTPPAVEEQSSGFWGSITAKATAVKQTAAAKWENFSDPDRKISLLQEQLRVANTEIGRLKTELSVQQIRFQVREQNLVVFQRAISDLNLLFVTGQMKHLIEVTPDGPPITPE